METREDSENYRLMYDACKLLPILADDSLERAISKE